VFHTNDINQGWDGRKDKKDCPEGVYIYYILYDGQGNVAAEKRRDEERYCHPDTIGEISGGCSIPLLLYQITL